MANQFNISTSKAPNRLLVFRLSVVFLAVTASAPAFAHGGYDHIQGTVVKVTNSVLTVKTAKGNVDVKLDKQTDLTRNNQKAQLADLKVGARVIVEVPEGMKVKIARSVKVRWCFQNR